MAHKSPTVKIARKLAYPIVFGPTARTLATLTPTTPDLAAFVNSAMTRYLDMADTRIGASVSHPADALPGLLAVAESEGCSGEEFLLAIVIAYEIQCRFVDVVPMNKLGWDQTSVVAIGTALGASRLMGLDKRQMLNALSLALIPCVALNQTRTDRISMWKGMAGPAGARQGVFASLLAREGMSGPDQPFEGDYGFWKQMFGEQYQIPVPNKFSKHSFAVEETVIKSFPIRFNCHAPVFAALDLRKKVKINEIKSLEIRSIRQAFERWIHLPEFWEPASRESADHSLPFCVSVAMLDGDITPETFDNKRYRNRDVKSLMKKCSVTLPLNFSDLAYKVRCCELIATTRKGKRISSEIKMTAKDDARGMSKAIIEKKFNKLTKPFLTSETREKLLKLCWGINKFRSVEKLVTLTGVEKT